MSQGWVPDQAQVGCIARALFRLSQWHGIAVLEAAGSGIKSPRNVEA